MKTPSDMDFLPLAVLGWLFVVGILMGSERGKLRAVFIPKRGFHPSALVGKGP